MNMQEYLNWLHEMAKENNRRQQIVYNDAHHDLPEMPGDDSPSIPPDLVT